MSPVKLCSTIKGSLSCQADEDVTLYIAPRGIVQPDQLLYSSTRHRDSVHGLRGVQGFVPVQVPAVGPIIQDRHPNGLAASSTAAWRR